MYCPNIYIRTSFIHVHKSLCVFLPLVTKGQPEEMEGATAVAVPGGGEEEEQSSSPLPVRCETGAAQTSSAFGEAKSRSEQHPLAGLSHRQRGRACGRVRRAVNAHEWLRLFNPSHCCVFPKM